MADVPLRQQIGAELRAARRDERLSLRGLASRSGVARSYLADLERGRYSPTPEVLEHIATAMDAQIVFRLRRSVAVSARTPGFARGDPAHARCLEAARRTLERHGLVTAAEQRVRAGWSHGWIDLLAFRPASRRLLIVEIKTELRDLGGLMRQVDVYARGCPEPARALGWHPMDVVVVALALATRENDACIVANRVSLARAFPVRGRRAISAILDGQPAAGRCLLMIDPRRPGRRVFTSCRADGRRSDAPYRDYHDFMEATRASGRVLGAHGGRPRPVSPDGNPVLSTRSSP